MRENNGPTARQPRHFGRVFGFAGSAAAVALAAACSSSLPNPTSTGTAGTGGSPTGNGTAGVVGDSPGTAGSGGTGGTGTGGSPARPACPTTPVTFGVCFVNDADVLPPPPPTQDPGARTNGASAAVVEGVGTGAAPAHCEDARFFGARGPSDWWFQARTGDNRLWTIGVHGLGTTPLVRANDSVTLDLEWRGTTISEFGPPSGTVQLTNASSTPLLWAVASAGTATVINNGSTWLTLVPNAPACMPQQQNPCDGSGYDVVATVNGDQAVVAPYAAADVGGYHVVTGVLVQPGTFCADYFGPPFSAAAVKLP